MSQLNKQNTTSQPDYTDATLAKRLAEAADNFRDGLYHYFISNLNYPYDVHYTAGYGTADQADNEADDILADLNSNCNDYYKFGPYKTDSDMQLPLTYDCIEITMKQNGIATNTQSVPAGIDAIILSLSAYDKFFQPYYVRLYGIDKAKEIRNEAANAFATTSALLVQHKKGVSSMAGTGGTRLIINNFEI